jgi:hypothetical protein
MVSMSSTQKTGSPALSVLNNIKVTELSLASRKTESFQAFRDQFWPISIAFITYHLIFTIAAHGKCGRTHSIRHPGIVEEPI